MSPVVMIVGLLFVLIIGGLLMAYLRSGIPHAIIQTALLYVGIVLVVIGLFFLVMPVLVWIYAQLHNAMGA